MSKETVLVCCSPAICDSDWLREMLETHVAPTCQTSILLVDSEPLHSVLAERWSGRAVMRYDADGNRYLRGIRQPKPWAPTNYPDCLERDAHEVHAFALMLAMKSAKTQDYSLRSFVFQSPMVIGSSLCHSLEASQKEWPGVVNVFRQPAPNDTEPPLVWVDTETSGLSPQKHTVLEIGATLTDSSGEIVRKKFDARCMLPDWADAERVALETNRYHTDPRWKIHKTHENMVRSFHQWLPDVFRLAGHNVKFDRSFLVAAFERYDLPPVDWSLPAIDTYPISNQLLKKRGLTENNRLETIARYFGLHTEELHGARVDIDTTREVYQRLMDILHNNAEDTAQNRTAAY